MSPVFQAPKKQETTFFWGKSKSPGGHGAGNSHKILIDSFFIHLYNSVAEPGPAAYHWGILGESQFADLAKEVVTEHWNMQEFGPHSWIPSGVKMVRRWLPPGKIYHLYLQLQLWFADRQSSLKQSCVCPHFVTFWCVYTSRWKKYCHAGNLQLITNAIHASG